MSNMDLWNKVCVTDPDATKRVNQRGGFTAIDAYSQIQKATEVFGAIGCGWGYTADITFHDDVVLAKVELWYLLKDAESEKIPVYSMKAWRGKDGKIDEDASKKAVTDALTKALSYLGFNADVFLGKFDDNKYVESLRPKPSPFKNAAERNTFCRNVIKSFEDAQTIVDLKELASLNATKLKEMDASNTEEDQLGVEEIRKQYGITLAQFQGKGN